jgi:colicin import membrane protein
MTARQANADTGLGVSFIVSTVIHLAVFLLVLWWSGMPLENMAKQETYYVDVVNLPVASPQAGSPTQKGNDVEQAPPPAVPEGPMTMPAPPKAKTKVEAKGKPAKGKESAAESSAFEEKMAKLESLSEAKHEEARIAQLRNKVKTQGSGRSGMPDGSGKEAGSDYTAYIQSRLKDAFHETISYSSKNPVVMMRIFIDTDGKLARRKTERSSGDRAFEISVLRAIELASEKFTPPPNHMVFEGVFVFRPQGVTQNRP